MLTNHLIRTLRGMNDTFGKGTICAVTINLDESNPALGEWYGTVTRRIPTVKDDVRFFKVENRVVTYLSRRRKLED